MIKNSHFKALWATFISSMILFIPLISASTFGYNYLNQGEKVQDGFNYTINVNNTDHFEGYTVASLWTYYTGLGNNLWCELTGCTMTGNLTTSGNITANDFYIPSMKGNNQYESINDWWNLYNSPGRLTGGLLSNPSGTNVVVASGEGVLRIADDDISQLKFIEWDTSSAYTVPTNSIMYFGVEYNGGSPQVFNTTDESDFDLDTSIPLGSAINQNDEIYILNNPWWVGDGLTNMIEKSQGIAGYLARDKNVGGLILGYTGTRNPTLTAGAVWGRTNEFEIDDFDASGTDTFDSYYRDGAGGYTEISDQSQWNNTHWDDGSGTLDTIDNNQYAVIWVFLNVGANELSLIFPQATYSNPANAEAEEVPSTFPSMWYKGGILVGRIIIQEGEDTPVEVQSAFTTQFTPAQASDHGNLAGLSDDDHTQYWISGTLRNGNYSTSGNISSSKSNATIIHSETCLAVNTTTNNCSIPGWAYYNSLINGSEYVSGIRAGAEISAQPAFLTTNDIRTAIFGQSILGNNDWQAKTLLLGLKYNPVYGVFANVGNRNVTAYGMQIVAHGGYATGTTVGKGGALWVTNTLTDLNDDGTYITNYYANESNLIYVSEFPTIYSGGVGPRIDYLNKSTLLTLAPKDESPEKTNNYQAVLETNYSKSRNSDGLFFASSILNSSFAYDNPARIYSPSTGNLTITNQNGNLKLGINKPSSSYILDIGGNVSTNQTIVNVDGGILATWFGVKSDFYGSKEGEMETDARDLILSKETIAEAIDNGTDFHLLMPDGECHEELDMANPIYNYYEYPQIITHIDDKSCSLPDYINKNNYTELNEWTYKNCRFYNTTETRIGYYITYENHTVCTYNFYKQSLEVYSAVSELIQENQDLKARLEVLEEKIK